MYDFDAARFPKPFKKLQFREKKTSIDVDRIHHHDSVVVSSGSGDPFLVSSPYNTPGYNIDVCSWVDGIGWVHSGILSGHSRNVYRLRSLVDENGYEDGMFFSTARDRLIRLWDLKGFLSGEKVDNFERMRFDSQTSHQYDIVVQKDSRVLFGGGGERHFQIQSWSLETGVAMRSYYGHMLRVFTLEKDPINEKILISGGTDESIRMWDTRIPASLPVWKKTVEGASNRVRMLPTKELVVVHQRWVSIFDLRGASKSRVMLFNPQPKDTVISRGTWVGLEQIGDETFISGGFSWDRGPPPPTTIWSTNGKVLQRIDRTNVMSCHLPRLDLAVRGGSCSEEEEERFVFLMSSLSSWEIKKLLLSFGHATMLTVPSLIW